MMYPKFFMRMLRILGAAFTLKSKRKGIPALVRRQIIDLFCLHNRCQEELELLKEKMIFLVPFLQNEIRLTEKSVDALLPHTDNPLNAGMIACLKKKQMIHRNHISSLPL